MVGGFRVPVLSTAGRVETFLKKEQKNFGGHIDEWKGNDDFYSILYGELKLVYHATADIEELVDDMFMLAKPPTPSSDTSLESLADFLRNEPNSDDD